MSLLADLFKALTSSTKPAVPPVVEQAIPPVATQPKAEPIPVPNRLTMLDAALSQYGLSEANQNPALIKLAQEAGQTWYTDTAVAWCGVFMTYLCVKAGVTPVATPAHARNWLNAGIPSIAPAPGDICIFSRGDANGQEGHVTLFIRRDGPNIYCLGGNQHDQVNIAAYNAENLLGIRRV